MDSPILRMGEILPERIICGAPFASKDAPIPCILSNRYFGVGDTFV